MSLKSKYIFKGRFGLERETLRVDSRGRLSHTPHPFPDDAHLDRDFCENQLELITPVCESIDSLMLALHKLDAKAKESVRAIDEYLWMNSNPPHFETEKDIPIAKFKGDLSFKRDYRLNLERRYGKRIMLYSGIHFNFSFDERLIHELYEESKQNDYKKFKTDLYFRLSKQVARYSWLLVLLTAASPVYDKSLDGDSLSGTGFCGFSSLRSSERGYWNRFIPVLDYSSLENYIKSIYRYIEDGSLFSPGELYLPVRLKPPGSNSIDHLIENGVDHIELRMFDINPLTPLGIYRDDIEFAHYYLMYLLQLPDFDFTPELQAQAIRNHKAAAMYDLTDITINDYPAIDAGLGLLDDMSEYFRDCPDVIRSINIQKQKLHDGNRYCEKVYALLADNYQENMFNISKGKE